MLAKVFSRDRGKRFRQVRDLAADFIKKRVAGVIYEPLAEPNGVEANKHIISKLCPTTFLNRLYGAEAELMRADQLRMDMIDNPKLQTVEILFSSQLIVRDSTQRT